MHAFLRAHPEVFMPAVKEVHFFGSDIRGLPYEINSAQYANLFRGAEIKQCVGATCAMALYSMRAAEEIRRESPQTKIVILLRDPVEMMYAFHSELVFQEMEPVRDFEKAVLMENDRKLGRNLPATGLPASIIFYRDMASYAEQVARYFRNFPREQVHVILFDDFQQDLPAVYRRLLEFLGVDPAFRPEFSTINPNKRVRSFYLRRLLKQPDPWTKVLGRILLPSTGLRQRVRGAIERWNVGFVPRSPMGERFRQRLNAELAPDIVRLSQMLQRDLGSWNH